MESEEGEIKDSESAKLQIAPLTQSEAAALFGVKMRTFSDAVKLLTSECAESLVMAVDQGHVAVSDAKRIIDHPNEAQDAAAKMVLEGAARTVRAAVKRIPKERVNGVENEESTGESWRSSNGRAALHNCGVSSLIPLVDKESVDTIIGHIPVGEGASLALRSLRDFLAHSLKDNGLALLLCSGKDLPEAFRYLRHRSFEYLCEIDYRRDVPTRPLGERHGVALKRMSLLVFGKSKSVLSIGDDVIQLPPVRDPESEVSFRERHLVGSELVVRRFAVHKGLVCDPLLLGGASNGLAAVRNGCRFVGACKDQGRFEYVRKYLARECAKKLEEGGPGQETTEAVLSAESSGRQLSLEG